MDRQCLFCQRQCRSGSGLSRHLPKCTKRHTRLIRVSKCEDSRPTARNLTVNKVVSDELNAAGDNCYPHRQERSQSRIQPNTTAGDVRDALNTNGEGLYKTAGTGSGYNTRELAQPEGTAAIRVSEVVSVTVPLDASIGPEDVGMCILLM